MDAPATAPPAPPRGLTPGRAALLLASVALVAASAGYSVGIELRRAGTPWTGMTWSPNDTLAVRRASGIGLGIGRGTPPGGVVQVHPGGPAARAGVRVGDRVLAVGPVPSDAEGALAVQARAVRPGDTLVYRLERDGAVFDAIVPVEPAHHTTRGAALALFFAGTAVAWCAIGFFVWLRRASDARATVFGLLCATAASTYLLIPVLSAQSAGGGLEPAGRADPALFAAILAFSAVGAAFAALLLHFALIFPRPRPVVGTWPQAIHWAWAGSLYPVVGLTVALAALLAARTARAAVAAAAVALAAGLLAAWLRRSVPGGFRARLARQPWLSIAVLVAAGAAVAALGQLATGPGLRAVRVAASLTALLVPAAGFLVTPLLLGACTVACLLRSYRESGLEDRQRIRWPMYGIVASLGVSLLLTIATLAAALTLDAERFEAFQTALSVGTALGTLLIPLGFAVGILRYRLLDLDVVIRRTAIYAAFLGALTVTFVVAVGLAGGLAVRVFGRDNALAAPLGTLAVALMALPVYRRVRDGLDRRFFRTRYDAGAVLRRIGEAVSHHAGGPALARRVAEELQVALRARAVAVLLRSGGALAPAVGLGVAPERLARVRVPLDEARRGPLGAAPHVPAAETSGALAEATRVVRAEVLVPVRLRGELHGVLAMGSKLSDEAFTEADLEFLAAAAGQLAFGVAGDSGAGRRRELDEAREIQASLLPARLPTAPGLTLAAHWQPATHVAGDYYDAFALEGARVALCVADVTGKGMPAALLMSNLQASVKALAPAAGSPAALCERLNRALGGQLAPGRFITFFYGEADAAARVLRYANAGHNPPLLLRADGRAEWLDAGGPLLGVVADANYAEAVVPLGDGDLLVLYTDGVTEAQAPSGELFGEARLLEAVRGAAGRGPDEVQRALLAAAGAFCDGVFADDATVLVLAVG